MVEQFIHTDIERLNGEILVRSQFIDKCLSEISGQIVGQHYLLERLMIALLSDGHILLEGNPGLAKTLAIKSLAAAFHVSFQRLQFTPDLLPGDITGTLIYNPGKSTFEVKKGPIFANFILADEINRAPAKVQSALLEAMAERQVTLGENTYRLPVPFLVMATQNPIEQEGTYPLPEAQVDRFMMKVKISYPQFEEERKIIRSHTGMVPAPEVKAVVSLEELNDARRLVKQIYLDEKIEKYILDIVFATRTPDVYRLKDIRSMISFGASPRASINLALAVKAHAFIHHRAYVTPDDVKAVAADILRHRIGITFEAEAENITSDEIIHKILGVIQVP